MPIRYESGKRIEVDILLGSVGQLSPPVPVRTQERRMWCWAACLEMLIERESSVDTRQCQLASSAFGRSDCCLNADEPDCDRPLAASKVSGEMQKYGLSSTLQRSALPFGEVCGEIQANRPIKAGLSLPAGGHAVLVVGYDTEEAGEWLLVHDPRDGLSRVRYSELLQAYGLGRWLLTWTSIRRGV
jgi:hypothetical protein